jgi:selenocysteine lyase/cysteine desulfurase
VDLFFEALLKNDVVVSLRFDREDRSWLRVSPHFYNTFDEIAKVADVLKREL